MGEGGGTCKGGGGVKASAQYMKGKRVRHNGMSLFIVLIFFKKKYQTHVDHQENSIAQIKIKQKKYLTFFHKCHQFQPCIISTF